MSRDRPTTGRIVTRLFLRRLIENDLISSHADRHESLAVLYAVAVSASVFVTFFVSTDYLAAFIPLPGPTALSALSDRFLFLAASMVVSGLATLMVWDALEIEPRDATILGPLPIPTGTIMRAKLIAALVFGGVLATALNVVPSVLYPLFLTLNMRGMHLGGILQLIAGHATSVFLAGLFGFFTVLTTRGVLRLLIGERAFRRIASAVQSALLVCMVTGLLLAPTVRAASVKRWIGEATQAPWPVRPALWYLGLNETIAGHLVADTPVVLLPRFSTVGYDKSEDDAARSAYRALASPLAGLARIGWQAVLVVAGLGLATFLWNNSRLPDRAAPIRPRSRISVGVSRTFQWLTRSRPEAQAGFFFTWQTLTRSAPHRTVIAIAAAGGSTYLLMTLATGGMHGRDIPSMPLGGFGISTMTLTALLVAFRYAVTVPAELGPNWTIRSAWHGDERAYLAGVKRTAIVALVGGPLLLLLPLHVALFGGVGAIWHSLVGVLLAVAILDGLFLGYRQFPFACSYVAIENPKLLWPTGLAALLLVTYGFADVERWALQTGPRTVALGAALCVLVSLVTVVDRMRRRERRPVQFDEAPASATQKLGLFDHP